MKIEQNDQKMLFNKTEIPDIFFSDYLKQMQGDYLKIYLYLIFISKYGKEVQVNDLTRNLSIPVSTVSDGMKYLEENNLILRTMQGYVITDLQEKTLNELYMPYIETTQEKLEDKLKNKERIQLVQFLNNTYFQGVMGPTWYSDIDTWLDKYGFDDQVLITLFDHCYQKSALHRNYVQVVAEAWHQHNIRDIGDLEKYLIEQEKTMKIKKDIAKKLGRRSGLTQYEEAYIEKWVNDYNYEMDVIEIALKRTTFRNNASFEYLNNVITDWHDRNLKTPAEVMEFLEKRKEQINNEKELKQKVKKENFEQRQYDNGSLDFLIKNNDWVEGESNGE